MSALQWQEVINTNLNSVFNVTRPVIDGMRNRKWGRIVQISSINGQKGQYGQANYAAAKAGMHGFTISLAQENAKFGITVNTVSPGYVGTDMVMAVPEEVRAKIVAQIPIGRLASRTKSPTRSTSSSATRRGGLPGRTWQSMAGSTWVGEGAGIGNGNGNRFRRERPFPVPDPILDLDSILDSIPIPDSRFPIPDSRFPIPSQNCCAAMTHLCQNWCAAAHSASVAAWHNCAPSRSTRTAGCTTPRSRATSRSKRCASWSSTTRSSRSATPRAARI
jgi:hypothetical protein